MSVNLLPGLPTVLSQPSLLAAVPGFGPTTGGNTVLIIGANLTGATSVTFGGTPATIVSQDPFGFLITVVAPAGSPGNVPVVVTTAAGASTPANYTYIALPAPTPTVIGITPPSGPAAGGTPFTIVGANLTGATVTFGGTPATNVQVIGGILLTGTTPPGTPGNATVQVTTPQGTVNVPGGFTYLAPPTPTVTSLTPATGPATGGTPFVITGTNLTGASVTIGGNPATNITVNATGTVLVGLTPAGTTGTADVTVTTPAGSTNATGGYTYS